MAVVHVTPRQLPKALRRLEGDLQRAVDRGLRNAAHAGMGLLMRESPVDQGELRASWRVSPARVGYELTNSAPHAGIVEEGARPHQVSLEGRMAILGWVRRHFPNLTEQEQWSFMEGIANKLAARGQEPTHFVRNNLEALGRIARSAVAHALAQVQGRA